ncbi:MAG: gamma-glutamyl-gamma-aminobutyrate hydrolase family protein [Candidatus Riflebacteria bacterium]|nr:gamma-glutamyl-gamma-aminobutyrate hydrolase family protein [Candidatus Riflebacteria bacterium]
MLPLIGCTTNVLFGPEPRCPSPAGCWYLNTRYIRAVEMAGGVPIALVPTDDSPTIDRLLDGLDGLLLTGGRDMDPSHFGEQPHPKAEAISVERTRFELELARRARARGLPLLGICLGLQTLNVAMGGSLYQDLPSQTADKLDHRQRESERGRMAHPVEIRPGTRLHGIIGRERLDVNSIHHQGVREIGRELTVSAVSPDGIVEGLEGERDHFLLSVQWHPEELTDLPEHAALFRALIEAARHA